MTKYKYISEEFLEEGFFSGIVDSFSEKFMRLNKKFKEFFTITEKDLVRNGINIEKRKNNIKKILSSVMGNLKSAVIKKNPKKFIKEFTKASSLVGLEIKSLFKESILLNLSNISNLTKSVVLAIMVYPLMFFLLYSMENILTVVVNETADAGILQKLIQIIWGYIAPIFCGIFAWFILPIIEEGATIISIKGGFGGSYFALTSLIDTVLYLNKGIYNMISKKTFEFSQIISHLGGAIYNIIAKAVKITIYAVGAILKQGYIAFLINILLNNFQRLFFISPLGVFHSAFKEIIPEIQKAYKQVKKTTKDTITAVTGKEFPEEKKIEKIDEPSSSIKEKWWKYVDWWDNLVYSDR